MWFTDLATIGEFFLQGGYLMYMLEDKHREDGIKVPGLTCIPSGLDYKIGKVYSPGHKMIVPVIYTHMENGGKIPTDFDIRDPLGNKWEAVEIHVGNFPKDSDACQLPGYSKVITPGKEAVYQSRDACKLLYPRIFKLLETYPYIEYQIINSTPDQAHDYKRP